MTARRAAGSTIFPGFMVGSEAVLPRPNGAPGSGWLGLIAPAEAGGAHRGLRAGRRRRCATSCSIRRKPSGTSARSISIAIRQLLERWGKLANATDTDLRDFRARGGKVLITYGWADAILQPLMGVNYYEKAVEANGRDGTDFMRLFMIPGMAHCAGGLGPDQYDAVTAVIDWVEKGVAPESLVAQQDRGRHRRRGRGRCARTRRSRATRGRAAPTTPRTSSAGCRSDEDVTSSCRWPRSAALVRFARRSPSSRPRIPKRCSRTRTPRSTPTSRSCCTSCASSCSATTGTRPTVGSQSVTFSTIRTWRRGATTW